MEQRDLRCIMRAYCIRRILHVVPVLLVVAITAFAITNLMPGDPIRLMLGDFATEAEVARMRESLGLDAPLLVRFGLYVRRLLQGDLGTSLFLNIPVTEAIFSRMGPTILLAFSGQMLAILLGIPLGILAAVRQRSIFDKLAMVIAVFGISIPSFWLAITFVQVFSVGLGVFPVAGYQPFSEVGFGVLRYIFLPACSIGIMQSGLLARMTRSSMLDVLGEDYMRTAKAKGIAELWVIIKHGLKNAAMPVMTVIGSSFSVLLAGTWIVESVFQIPGTGSLAITAIMRRDYPLIQGSIVFIALVYVGINLLVDLSYAFFDPRVELE